MKQASESFLTKRGPPLNELTYSFLNEFQNEINKSDPSKAKNEETKDILAFLTMDVFTQQDLDAKNDENNRKIQQTISCTERNLNLSFPIRLSTLKRLRSAVS